MPIGEVFVGHEYDVSYLAAIMFDSNQSFEVRREAIVLLANTWNGFALGHLQNFCHLKNQDAALVAEAKESIEILSKTLAPSIGTIKTVDEPEVSKKDQSDAGKFNLWLEIFFILFGMVIWGLSIWYTALYTKRFPPGLLVGFSSISFSIAAIFIFFTKEKDRFFLNYKISLPTFIFLIFVILTVILYSFCFEFSFL